MDGGRAKVTQLDRSIRRQEEILNLVRQWVHNE